MNETEITIKSKVFSDPEYCNGTSKNIPGMPTIGICPMWNNGWCYGFQKEAELTKEKVLNDRELWMINKLPECKEALKQANK